MRTSGLFICFTLSILNIGPCSSNSALSLSTGSSSKFWDRAPSITTGFEADKLWALPLKTLQIFSRRTTYALLLHLKKTLHISMHRLLLGEVHSINTGINILLDVAVTHRPFPACREDYIQHLMSRGLWSTPCRCWPNAAALGMGLFLLTGALHLCIQAAKGWLDLLVQSIS